MLRDEKDILVPTLVLQGWNNHDTVFDKELASEGFLDIGQKDDLLSRLGIKLGHDSVNFAASAPLKMLVVLRRVTVGVVLCEGHALEDVVWLARARGVGVSTNRKKKEEERKSSMGTPTTIL
jgi:hypothetical protein